MVRFSVLRSHAQVLRLFLHSTRSSAPRCLDLDPQKPAPTRCATNECKGNLDTRVSHSLAQRLGHNHRHRRGKRTRGRPGCDAPPAEAQGERRAVCEGDGQSGESHLVSSFACVSKAFTDYLPDAPVPDLLARRRQRISRHGQSLPRPSSQRSLAHLSTSNSFPTYL